MHGAAEKIETEVLSWDGVSKHPGRFGGVQFRLGRRELGHLHGDRIADIPFTKLTLLRMNYERATGR